MEEAALKRRERLAALKAGAPISQIRGEEEDIIQRLAYADKLQEDEEPITSTSIFAGDKTLEEKVKFLLEEAKNLPSLPMESGEVTLDELAPRRANADLKQDYERRTESLRKAHELACIELIRKNTHCFYQ